MVVHPSTWEAKVREWQVQVQFGLYGEILPKKNKTKQNKTATPLSPPNKSIDLDTTGSESLASQCL
jgi:hypothetical protein